MNDFLNISLYLFLLISSLKMSARISKDSLAIDEPRGNETYFCDACGCASTGGSMGFSSLSGGSFIGLRYLGQEYRSRDGIYENSAWIEEYFNTLQLWANYPVSDRISVSAILPYHFHHRQFANATSQQISGIGDFSILGFYKVFREYQQEYLDAEQTDFRQELRFGGGIKLPLGSYQRANNEGSVNPGFQLGTGSWDFILAGSYQLNYRDWGGKLQANYILKQENQQGYRFGNQLNTSLLFYRNFSWIDLKKSTAGEPGAVFGSRAGNIWEKPFVRAACSAYQRLGCIWKTGSRVQLWKMEHRCQLYQTPGPESEQRAGRGKTG